MGAAFETAMSLKAMAEKIGICMYFVEVQLLSNRKPVLNLFQGPLTSEAAEVPAANYS